MATRLIDSGRASALPTVLLAQAVPMLTRHELEALTERLIEALDSLHGDLDQGRDGDELDGTAAEDDFYPHSNWRGEPGCPVSDPPEDDDEDYCLASDDRGTSMPNAYFPGYVAAKEIDADDDYERSEQPTNIRSESLA